LPGSQRIILSCSTRPWRESEYKNLPLQEAQKAFDEAAANIKSMLYEFNVLRQIVEKAFSRSSLALSKLTIEERQLVGGL
jgi:hypothetical protein